MDLKGSLVTINNNINVPNGPLMLLQWNQSIYDTQGIWSGSSLIVPAGVTAVKIFFQVRWDWGNDPNKSVGYRIAEVRKNGSDDSQLAASRITAAPSTDTIQNGSTPAIPVDAGDQFELWVGQGSGHPLDVIEHQTWLAMEIFQSSRPNPPTGLSGKEVSP